MEKMFTLLSNQQEAYLINLNASFYTANTRQYYNYNDDC